MNYTKLAERMAEFKKEVSNNTLKAVIISGKGEGYYFDMVSKTFILVKKGSEMYYLPIKEDENDQISLFLPYIFGSVAIILVPKEDVIFIGDN